VGAACKQSREFELVRVPKFYYSDSIHPSIHPSSIYISIYLYI